MDECCPKFNVKKWNKKMHLWRNKPFISESIPQLFHIPFFPMIGWKITKMWNLTTKEKAAIKPADTLILFNDPTPFRSDILLAVSRKINGANNKLLSGTFYSEVFDGEYNAIPKFIDQINQSLLKNKKKANDYYIHYAYCPKCAEKYGHNYVVVFAKLN